MGVRRAMDVARKPSFKKKKEVKVTRTQEELDVEKYISESFYVVKESADQANANK